MIPFNELEAKKAIMAMLIGRLPGDTTIDTFESMCNSMLSLMMQEWQAHEKRHRPTGKQA